MSEIKESSPAEIERERWDEETLKPALNKHPERKKSFQSVSLDEVERLYTPSDTADLDFARDISFPGKFPYTRGIHPTGYRGKLWTMRQFAGFGTPESMAAPANGSSGEWRTTRWRNRWRKAADSASRR